MSRRLLLILIGTFAGAACAATKGVATPQPFPAAPGASAHNTATPPPTPVPFPLPGQSSPTAASTDPASPPLPETTLLVSTTAAPPTLTPIPVAGPDAVAPPATASPARRVDALMKTALSLQGTRYHLGGEEPESGFDCSGFVHYLFELQQIDLPRTVAEQFDAGQKVKFDDMERGDLLFFTTTAKGPTHVGIALGPASLGQFVHAPGSGGVVRIEHFDTSYWRTRLLGVRRVIK